MSDLTFIALDFETATSQRASVCEVGLAFVENGEIGMSRSNLIRPPHNQYDSANIAVHGITPIMTDISPGFEMFWPTLANILQGKTVVAHYAPFDMGVIREECLRCGLPLPEFRFVCSCALARYVVPGFYSYGLEPLCDHFGITTEGHHRAGNPSKIPVKVSCRGFLPLWPVRCEGFDSGGMFCTPVQVMTNEAYPSHRRQTGRCVGTTLRPG